MNRLRSPHTGAPCVRRRTCGAAQKRRGGFAAPKRWWGRPSPTRSVGPSSCGPRPQTFVLARGGNHVPRRGISRPRPWRKPRASCAELLFPAWDYAPHPRGTPAVQWFWKDNPPGRLAASSPLYTRGPLWCGSAAKKKAPFRALPARLRGIKDGWSRFHPSFPHRASPSISRAARVFSASRARRRALRLR